MLTSLPAGTTLSAAARLRRGLAVLFGAVLLLWPALLNRFPLLYPDSIMYLHYAPQVAAAVLSPHTHPPFEARAEIYDLALFVLGPHTAPWGMLFFQALLTSWTLWLVVRWICRPAGPPSPARPDRTLPVFLLVLTVLAAASGLSWVVSWVLTDVFGGTAYLCLCLIVLAWETLTRAERWSVAAIACWGIAAHPSHILLAAFVCAVLGLLLLLRCPALLGRERLLALAAAMPVLAGAALMATHAYLYGEPSLTSYHPPYLTARIIADGPGRWYLQQHCPQLGWVVCRNLATLPAESNEILFAPHGLRQYSSPADQRLIQRQEMPLVLAAVRQYPKAQLRASLKNFMRQMGMFRFDEFGNWPDAIYGMNWVLPNEAQAYLASRQARNRMPSEPARIAQIWLLSLSGALLILTLPSAWYLRAWRSLTLAAVLLPTVVANAFVCGALSQPDERLQLRIVWLFPLAVLLLVAETAGAFRAHRRA